MNNINIGVAKSIIASKLRDDFLQSQTINESKNITSHFYFLMEGSDYLRGQYDAINNIENKKVTNETIAKSYIDDNLSNLKKYSYKQINEANKKLSPFINTDDLNRVDEDKKNLYNAITTLIEENSKNDSDINLIYESYDIIIGHMMKPSEKENITENVDQYEGIDMDIVLPIAMGKFNKKYSNLNENERKLINKLAIGDNEEKKKMFESLKEENLEILSSVEKNGIEDKINETVERLSNMEYTDETSTKDVISLYELKKNLS